MIPNTILNLDCREGFRQLEDNSVDFILTSPPYNVGGNNMDSPANAPG